MEVWKKELNALTRVMDAWVRLTNEDAANGELLSDAAEKYRHQFSPMGGADPVNELERFKTIPNRATWMPLDGYFPAAGVLVRTKTADHSLSLWPLLSLDLRERSGRLEMSARLGMFFADDGGYVNAYGWRFDSADSEGDSSGSGFHGYAHVQHISGWKPGQLTLTPPGRPLQNEHWVEHELQMLETRPAFPLACTTPAGLLAAVLVSIYGGSRVESILDGAGVGVMKQISVLTGVGVSGL